MTSLVHAEPRQLGPLGEVGPLSYGLWRFTTNDVDHAHRLIETALGHGLNLIDTADVYGLDWGGTGFGQVEQLLGQVLASAPTLRSQMVLATKGGIAPPTPYDSSPSGIRAACEASLRRLGVDTIDLYQIHRPDLFTHPAELAATLSELHAAGKIRALGVSNYTPAQTTALMAHLEIPLVTVQPEFSATHLEPIWDGTFDLCLQTGLTPLAWSALAGGRLASGDGLRADLIAVLDELADREGCERSHIALAFILTHPTRPIAIIGTQQPERLAQSVRSLEVHLDRNDVYRIIVASQGVPLP
jgi:predicted oxidoreductase